MATTTHTTLTSALALLAFVLGGCATTSGPARRTPTTPTPIASAPRERVRILALNAAMLPGPFGTDNAERIDRITDRILTEPGPDVVVLMEVFDEGARDVLTRRLATSHPWMVRHAGARGALREDSGLFVASRIPFVGGRSPRTEFRSYRTRGPWHVSDHWCDRGALGVELDLGRARSLCLLATHLQADYTHAGQYRHIRDRQVRELQAFARTFVASVPAGRSATTLLVGDLNIVGEEGPTLAPTAEYLQLGESLLATADLFRHTHPQDAGFTWNHDPEAPGADERMPQQRLDYALALDALLPPARRLRTVARADVVTFAPGLTDHRALAVEMSMNPFPLPDPMGGL